MTIDVLMKKIGNDRLLLPLFFHLHLLCKEQCPCPISNRVLAKWLKVSEITVRRKLKELENAGVITISDVATMSQQCPYRKQVETVSVSGSSSTTQKQQCRDDVATMSQKETPVEQSVESIVLEKKMKFKKRLEQWQEKYDAALLNDFIDYWCEHSESSIVLRWEKEKVFEIGRRLATFKRNRREWKR